MTMSPSVYRRVNYVAFQACWLACILGAAAGMPILGPIAVAIFVALHLAVSKPGQERAGRIKLLIIAGVIGYVADSALVLLGILAFPPAAALGWPTSLWMVALWVNLAATLNASMSWLGRSRPLAIVFGVIGGPLAYLAGARLGAATLGPTLAGATLVIAVEWALAMPLLVRIASVVGAVPEDAQRPGTR